MKHGAQYTVGNRLFHNLVGNRVSLKAGYRIAYRDMGNTSRMTDAPTDPETLRATVGKQKATPSAFTECGSS